jgi:hypothetical protein
LNPAIYFTQLTKLLNNFGSDMKHVAALVLSAVLVQIVNPA